MKTNLKKPASLVLLIVSAFFITSNAIAGGTSVPDTGKMSKMSHSKMSSKMAKKKKMDKMSDSKMKPASDGGKM